MLDLHGKEHVFSLRRKMGQLSWAGVAKLRHTWEEEGKEEEGVRLNTQNQPPGQTDCCYRLNLHRKNELSMS